MTNLTIIGTGLIGGSMAAAWKKAGVCQWVTACDINEKSVQKALELGVADRATTSIEEAVKDADIIVVATPILVMGEVFSQVARFMKTEAVVTDVGSTRLKVIELARCGLGERFSRYAPAHPIAGGELPGVEQARADLFDQKVVISTPTSPMNPLVVRQVESWWTQAGAKIQRMTPEQHDEIFAAVSHLPHLLAYALVDMIAKDSQAMTKLKMAGAGFRDFTRIAASSPVMWRDICLANRQAISEELRKYRLTLDRLQQSLDNEDGDALMDCFENAMRNRRGLVFAGKK